MIVNSPCKINLGLKVINKREDNFHNILSIFIELNLFDTIEFIESDKPSVEFIGANIPKNNTVTKALSLIKKYYNIKINHKIKVIKKIPIGGGLGGGSSNGAYILKSINQLYELSISNRELLVLSKKFGSDVPFIIFPKAHLVDMENDGRRRRINKSFNIGALYEYIISPRPSIDLIFPSIKKGTSLPIS